MKTKRIVITGGPGTGKTSLISYLETIGYNCMQEISREITLTAQESGVDQLFLQDPLLFSDHLLKGRLAQYHEAIAYSTTALFYDRGLPDVTAYMDYLGIDYPSYFEEICQTNRYDAIFLLPPWETIYTQDNERYETFEQAEHIYKYLRQAYETYGYNVHHVPTGSVEYRTEFILNVLTELH